MSEVYLLAEEAAVHIDARDELAVEVRVNVRREVRHAVVGVVHAQVGGEEVRVGVDGGRELLRRVVFPVLGVVGGEERPAVEPAAESAEPAAE